MVKHLFLRLIMLSALTILAYSSIYLTKAIKSVLAEINYVVDLRYRSFEMAWQSQRIAESRYTTQSCWL